MGFGIITTKTHKISLSKPNSSQKKLEIRPKISLDIKQKPQSPQIQAQIQGLKPQIQARKAQKAQKSKVSKPH